MMQRQETRTLRAVNLEQSLSLTKNLLRTAFSTVAFSRNLFPMNCFSERQLTDITINTLQSEDPESTMFNHWLEEGIFPALEQQVLESVMFGVCSVETGALLECYRFAVSYPAGQSEEDEEGAMESHSVTFSIQDGRGSSQHAKKKKIIIPNKHEIKQQTVSMIRNLIALTSTLSALPAERFLSLKLSYVQGTDDSFQPKYFKEVTEDDPLFHVKPSFMRIGNVSTPHHFLRLQLTAVEEEYDMDSQRTQHPRSNIERYDPLMMDDSDDDQDVVVWDRSGPTHNPSALAAVKLEPGVEETADSGRMDVDEEQAEPSQKQQSKKKKKKKKKTAPAKRAPTRVTRSSMPVNVKLEPGLIAISPFEVAQMIRDFVREEAKSAANVPTLTAIRKRFNTTQPIAREAFLTLIDDGVLTKKNRGGFAYDNTFLDQLGMNSSLCDPFLSSTESRPEPTADSEPMPLAMSPIPETAMESDSPVEKHDDPVPMHVPVAVAVVVPVEKKQKQKKKQSQKKKQKKPAAKSKQKKQKQKKPKPVAKATSSNSPPSSQGPNAATWYDGVDTTNIISGGRSRRSRVRMDAGEEHDSSAASESEEVESKAQPSASPESTITPSVPQFGSLDSLDAARPSATPIASRQRNNPDEKLAKVVTHIKDPHNLNTIKLSIRSLMKATNASQIIVQEAMASLVGEGVLYRPNKRCYRFTDEWQAACASVVEAQPELLPQVESEPELSESELQDSQPPPPTLTQMLLMPEEPHSAPIRPTPTQVLMVPEGEVEFDLEATQTQTQILRTESSGTQNALEEDLPATQMCDDYDDEEDIPMTQIVPETVFEEPLPVRTAVNTTDEQKSAPINGWNKRTFAIVGDEREMDVDESPELYMPSSQGTCFETLGLRTPSEIMLSQGDSQLAVPKARAGAKKRKRASSIVSNPIVQNVLYDNQAARRRAKENAETAQASMPKQRKVS